MKKITLVVMMVVTLGGVSVAAKPVASSVPEEDGRVSDVLKAPNRPTIISKADLVVVDSVHLETGGLLVAGFQGSEIFLLKFDSSLSTEWMYTYSAEGGGVD